MTFTVQVQRLTIDKVAHFTDSCSQAITATFIRVYQGVTLRLSNLRADPWSGGFTLD